VVAAAVVAPASADERDVRRALEAATVVVESTGCTGVVSESPQLVLTAKHCVDGVSPASGSTGDVRTAWVVATNSASDQAVLFLEEPAGVEPLELARRAQIPGAVLYFEGDPRRRASFQTARLDHLGRCPSLPELPNALFTSIDGVPGDSGAPLVDAAARVVGLVHGGARCPIATPASTLARLVDGSSTRAGRGGRIAAAPFRARVHGV
jgi:S1-C subfamily serine protease